MLSKDQVAQLRMQLNLTPALKKQIIKQELKEKPEETPQQIIKKTLKLQKKIIVPNENQDAQRVEKRDKKARMIQPKIAVNLEKAKDAELEAYETEKLKNVERRNKKAKAIVKAEQKTLDDQASIIYQNIENYKPQVIKLPQSTGIDYSQYPSDIYTRLVLAMSQRPL